MESQRAITLEEKNLAVVIEGLFKSLREPILIEIRDAINEHMEQAVPNLVKLEILKQKICLTPDEVEALYSIPQGTLKVDRCKGKGPSYIKDGRTVLYFQEVLKQYFIDRAVKTIKF